MRGAVFFMGHAEKLIRNEKWNGGQQGVHSEMKESSFIIALTFFIFSYKYQ